MPGDPAQYVKEQFPFLAPWLNDPEIGPILLQAGGSNGQTPWSPERLKAVVMGTGWWQRHSAAMRTYEQLKNTDPAELNHQISSKWAEVHDVASSMGLTAADTMTIAQQAVMYGWSPAEIRDQLSNAINMDTTKTQGLVQTTFNQAKDTAAQYFIKGDDGMNLEFARRVASGEMSSNDIAGYYRDRAKTEYGYMAPVLDQGITMAQYFNPHRQEIAKLLEVSPDAVDLQNDPKYQEILRMTDADTGKVRPMSLTEVQDWSRKQDGWKHTANAMDTSSSFALDLAKTFGGIG